MVGDNGIFFSSHYSKAEFEDFLRRWKGNILNPREMSYAIDMFSDRMKGRFFNQMAILNEDPYSNGFASMALCCLLIDTLHQFRHGIQESGPSDEGYIPFLMESMPDVFDTHPKAQRFYKDIRCGILHAAQTSHGSMLDARGMNAYNRELNRPLTEEEIENTITLIGKGENPPICVNVVLLERRLYTYFQDYLSSIRQCDRNSNIKTNFIRKLRYMHADG